MYLVEQCSRMTNFILYLFARKKFVTFWRVLHFVTGFPINEGYYFHHNFRTSHKQPLMKLHDCFEQFNFQRRCHPNIPNAHQITANSTGAATHDIIRTPTKSRCQSFCAEIVTKQKLQIFSIVRTHEILFSCQFRRGILLKSNALNSLHYLIFPIYLSTQAACMRQIKKYYTGSVPRSNNEHYPSIFFSMGFHLCNDRLTHLYTSLKYPLSPL